MRRPVSGVRAEIRRHLVAGERWPDQDRRGLALEADGTEEPHQRTPFTGEARG